MQSNGGAKVDWTLGAYIVAKEINDRPHHGHFFTAPY